MSPPPATHVVDSLLRVLAKAGLPPPDVLEVRDDEVVALYHEHKLAVVVHLGDDADDEGAAGTVHGSALEDARPAQLRR